MSDPTAYSAYIRIMLVEVILISMIWVYAGESRTKRLFWKTNILVGSEMFGEFTTVHLELAYLEISVPLARKRSSGNKECQRKKLLYMYIYFFFGGGASG